MNKSSISCDLHDYVEVACLYGYRIVLTLNDQRIIEGQAVDIMTAADKREFLVIDIAHGQKEQIELNQIRKMQVQTPNAKFSEVVF